MTKEEYEHRFALNNRITAYGLDTTIHMPCPFCAAADFAVYRFWAVEEVMREEHICGECKRGSRVIFEREGGGTIIRPVQTRGDDPPDYAKMEDYRDRE